MEIGHVYGWSDGVTGDFMTFVVLEDRKSFFKVMILDSCEPYSAPGTIASWASEYGYLIQKLT